MYRSLSLVLAGGPLLLLVFTGCNSDEREWDVAVQNKSDVLCSVYITLSPPHGDVKIEGLKKARTHILIRRKGRTVVEKVKVIHGKDELTLTPGAELPAGKRYAVVVGVDGKVDASILDR